MIEYSNPVLFWLQWNGQREMQDGTKVIYVLKFGASYIRGLLYVSNKGPFMLQFILNVQLFAICVVKIHY